ncbi:Mycothiol acetyltransferase [Massilia sp. Bi118]|uniref:GNAT family N-acetyltransferase n=1 Tax=Massilia sp. Bi118 TaxID=2822346 RepID=UPI001DA9D52D|nr:N-acetyltransferase [Massilia sp. Bi118]CAH0288053.1 Mycothiol acetyltransferase [Massilia sp. Bi118]
MPTIRQLTPSDTAAYRELRLASLRDFQFAHGPDHEEALAKGLDWHARRLAKQDYHWFGAFDGAQSDAPLVGAICLRMQEGRRLRHAASLNSLMVARSHQRAGIGRLLVAHLIGFARSLGTVRQLTLEVNESNLPARRLYDSFGFRQFGLEPDAIHHEGRYCAKQHLVLSLVSQHPNEQPIS